MVLAEHYLRGQELKRAAQYFARAAVELAEGSDLAGALRCVERGLGCGATGEVLGTLHAVAAWAHFWSWNFAAAHEAAHAALPLLEAGSAAWCRALGMVLSMAVPLGRRDIVQAHIGTLVQAEPAPGAEGVYLEQLWVLVVGLVLMVLRDELRAVLGRMQAILSRLGENELRARGLLHVSRSVCGLGEGDFWTYRSEAEAAMACFVAVGDRRYQIVAETHAGLGQALLGDEEAAAARLRAALELGRRLGESMMEGVLQTHIAHALLESGRPEHLGEAEALAQAMIANSGALTFWSALGYCVLAGVHLERGEFAAAEHAARQAHPVVEAIGPLSSALLGRALLAQGTAEAARAVVDAELATLARRGGSGFMDIKLHLVAAEVRRAQGEPEAARESLDRAAELLEQRAARIPDPTVRENYLGRVRDHVRVAELRRRW
jgi:tetratricopeptide (TPR) repeat protein